MVFTLPYAILLMTGYLNTLPRELDEAVLVDGGSSWTALWRVAVSYTHLDGAWVNGLAKQGAIASMDDLMKDANYDQSQIADIIKVDGHSVMFPLASFVYPVFVNLDMAKANGVDTMPATRTEFMEAAKKMTHADKNEYGWVLPLSLQNPGGIQNDVMSWVWASGASMMKDGICLLYTSRCV